MMTGFLLRYDSLEEHSCLTDEQYGRIIRAALKFARDGTEPELPDPERFLWPGLRQKVLYDRAQYEKKCAQNTENINKRWERQREQETDPEPEEADTNVYDRIRPDTNDTNININNNPKSISNPIPSSNQSKITSMEQLRAAGYTDSEIERAKKRCGGKRIRNLPAYIKQSIDNERHDRAVGKHVSAQDFEQRDYSEVEEQIKRDLAKRIEEYKREHPEEFDDDGRLKT